LRHQDWAPVNTEILLPVGITPDGRIETAKVTTHLTCQGTVMTDKNKIEILSKNSSLKPDNFDDLKNEDTIDAQGNKVVSLTEYEPNVVSILDKLFAISSNILIKTININQSSILATTKVFALSLDIDRHFSYQLKFSLIKPLSIIFKHFASYFSFTFI
jgi:hypothetical protein